jgi:UDP-3-O-[3-hydroxymyristoyl] glucosamine N-acyltransferase
MQVTARVGDPRFFAATGPHRLGVIAAAAGLAAPPQPDRVFHGVAPLQTAGPADVSFLDNARYADQLQHTQAGAVVLAAALLNRVPPTAIGLPSPQPYLAWARICALFFPPAPPPPGCHPSAVVDRAARIDPTAAVGPGAVVSARAEIGPGTTIGANATIGPGTVIGASCTIGAGCSLSHAVLGDRVRLLPGARIGQDGFGFAPDGAGGYVTVPQLGRVILEDDVEIGANTAIDRGSMRDTVVGAGTRIDNLVQIGHNVQIGPGCVIVSQAGISGSTTLGHHVQVAGQAGLTGHLTIGDRARIGAQAGVMDDVPGGASIVGSPAQPVREFFQHVMALRRLARRELDAGRGTEQRN